MHIKSLGCLLSWILILTTLPAADEPHRIVPSDYSSVASITQVAISPLGQRVAYSDARWQV